MSEINSPFHTLIRLSLGGLPSNISQGQVPSNDTAMPVSSAASSQVEVKGTICDRVTLTFPSRAISVNRRARFASFGRKRFGNGFAPRNQKGFPFNNIFLPSMVKVLKP